MAKEAPRAARIESITVTVTTANGRTHEIHVDPEEHDSLFWSTEAIDKFALPYYVTTRSVDQAAAIRRQVDAQVGASGQLLAAHKRLCTVRIVDLTKSNPELGD
jgi:hypothetical protein